ncbi:MULTISPECIES: hypothetical protein [unclassified Sphingobium]|uniref:hypothetical protein n=1 Tax=unclassified Sphingobium TaxID=2611147 RepID=UPI0022245B65|nr:MULTISPECIES: hypothetical protein [unclassified Sphingobium]MCW2410381.1 hypothetical protein [Sphingobium sp. B8D3D]MCW2413926.1 hypothetical protein [Sphingobium sp. B8D3A]
MNWHYGSDIYVSRDALIAFAWSAPMRDLAAKVQLSDVGLKKLLRGHGVVTPPQGYWNKVAAGKPVPAPPRSPARRPGETGRIGLDHRFRGLIEETPPIAVRGPFVSDAVPERLEELHARELKAIGRIAVPRDLDRPHVGLAQLLKRENARRQKSQGSQWHWDQPRFDNPLGQRQLRLLNGLFLALASRGHSAEVREDNGRLAARCIIGHMALGLSITTVGKHRTETIAGYQRPARDLPASTPLGMSLAREFRTELQTAWQDDEAGKLEAKLAVIATDIIVAGEASFRQSLVEAIEQEERERKWAEERRQQRIAELEARRLADLKMSGQLLTQAEEIRNLVARVKAAAVAGNADIDREELVAWENWALDYANRVDPVLSGQIISHVRVPELN